MPSARAEEPWRWYNQHRLYFALDKCEDLNEVNDVLDGLDDVLANPSGPMTTPMRGTHDHVDRVIALLPRGWVVVYSIYPNGVPPQRAPGLLVRDLRCEFPGIDSAGED